MSRTPQLWQGASRVPTSAQVRLIFGSLNICAYVGDDPINAVDPLGLQDDSPNDPPQPKKPHIICTGTRIQGACGEGGIANWASGFSSAGVGGQYAPGTGPNAGEYRCTNCGLPGTQEGRDIVVTAPHWEWVSTGQGAPSAWIPRALNFNPCDFQCQVNIETTQCLANGLAYPGGDYLADVSRAVGQKWRQNEYATWAAASVVLFNAGQTVRSCVTGR